METTQRPLPAGNRVEQRLITLPVLVVAAVVLVVCLGAVQGRLQHFGGDPSYFILACEGMAVPGESVPGVTLMPGGHCYDGVAYFRLALDPFTTERAAFGLYLDKPAYRHQRILYPFLAWAVTGGDPARVPWAMIGINILAAVALCAGGAALLQHWRRWPYWAVFVFVPGVILALARSCGEVVSLAFLVWGLVWLVRERLVWAAIFLSLAVLARETAVLFPAAAMLVSVWKHGRRTDAWQLVALAAPLVVAMLLQGVLWQVWGVLPVMNGGENLGPPFAGMAQLVERILPMEERAHTILAVELLYLTLLVVAVAVTCRSVRHGGTGVSAAVAGGMKLAFAGNVILGLCLSYLVWVEDWAFMRTLSEGMVLGVLLLCAAPGRLAAWLRVPVLGLQCVLLVPLVERTMRTL